MSENDRTVKAKPDWCLLCFSPVTSDLFFDDRPLSPVKFERIDHDSEPRAPLGKQLHTIFILKNCLDLPNERLSYYLYKWGSPEHWVNLCSKCVDVVKDAKKIHSEILKLEKTFTDIKLKIVEVLKSSSKREVFTRESKEYKKRAKERKNAMEITNLTRCYVKKHDYEHERKRSSSFRAGDLKALELMQRQSSKENSESHIPEPDFDEDDDDNDENMSAGDYTSSSSDSEDDDDDTSDNGSDSDGETGRKLKEKMKEREGTGKKPKKGDAIRCSTCNKQFGSEEQRDAHEQVHKSDATSLRHKCPFCQMGFSRMDYYRIHVRSHKVLDKPAITKEDRKLAKAQEKERKVQEKQRKYPCTECNEAFPKLKLLEKHLVDEHEGEIAPVVCDLCGKSFARELSLKKHVRKVHETERVYNLHCIHCGMGMKSPGKLRKHLKEAHNVWEMGQYFCEMEGCKKKYQFKVDHEVHMAKHNGNAPFKCEHCGKDFWQSQQMKKHVIVIHSGNRESKPFMCDLCGKAFAIKHYVYTHKRKVHFKKDNNKPNFQYLHGQDCPEEGGDSNSNSRLSLEHKPDIDHQQQHPGYVHAHAHFGEPSNSSMHIM